MRLLEHYYPEDYAEEKKLYRKRQIKIKSQF